MDVVFDREDKVTPPGGAEVVFRQVGAGETMLVLHGGSGSWRHWARNLKALSQSFTLVLPDLPGFGDSGDVPRRMAMADYLALVGEAVQMRLPGDHPFHLVGFSFGGMIGAGLAAGLGPRIKKFTLLAPGGFGKMTGPKLDLRKPAPGMSEPQVRAVYRHNVEELMLADREAIEEEAVTNYRENLERARFRNRHLSSSYATPPWLAAIRAPMQLLYGEKDVAARPTVQARIQKCLEAKPDIRPRVIPGAGHWVQWERADEVNRLLLEFHGNGTQ